MEKNSLSPLKLLEYFCECDYVRRDTAGAVECLSEDIHWFGTSDAEDIHNLEEAKAFITEEIEKSPDSYQIEFSEGRENLTAEGLGIATVKMKISANGLIMLSRITCVTKLQDGIAKICEMHTSFPEEHQEQGEYFPFEFSRQHESDVVLDFVNTALPGGVFGFSLEEDFPLAIINQNMLLYLGYRNEREYLRDTEGKLVNAIHPDDRRVLRLSVSEAAEQGDEFKALLRIRKNDGSYFWADIKGTLNRDRSRITCLCLDATELVMANNQLENDRLKMKEYASRLMEKEQIISEDAVEMSRLRKMKGLYGERKEKEEGGKTPGGKHVRWKDAAVIMASVAAIIAAVVGFTFYLYDIQWEAAADAVRTASLSGVQCVSNSMNADQQILTNTADLLGRLDDREEAGDTLKQNINSGFDELILSYDGGECFSSLSGPSETAREEINQLVFANGRNVSRTFHGKNGKKQIAYRTDVFSGGEKTGALFGIVNLSGYYVPEVMEFYEGRGFSCVIDGESGDFIIGKTGTVPQGEDRGFYDVLAESEDDKTVTELKSALTGGRTGSTVVNMPGEKMYLYFLPLNNGSPACLIAMIPYNMMRKESSGMVYLGVAFIVVILLAAALLIIYNNRIAGTKIQEREYRNTLFRLLAENVDSVFLIFDSETDEIDYVSENIERILGIGFDMVKGGIIRNEKLSFTEKELLDIKEMMDEKENFYFDFRYRNPLDDKQQLLRLSGYVPEGTAWQKKWIFCISDRTDEVLKERRLEQAVKESDEASRAKSEFLANMSHDIRTPMNGIIGMTQLALQDGVSADSMRVYLEKISTSSAFLLTLINDILDMSKIESGMIELHPKPYPMKEVSGYLDSVIMPLAREKNIDIETDIDETIIISVDQQRFNQILFNLLSNAVKYTEPNGRVALTIRGKRGKNGKFHMTAAVEDNGIGMSAEFQKRMFKSFTQESRKIMGMSGTGLGLAIVKKLVDLMDGTIQVESSIGRGSLFTVELDAPEADKPCEEGQKQKAEYDSAGESARVLLCEDNAINQEIMLGILEFLGAEPELAVNGKEGVEKFQSQNPGFYSAVLMDCRMPVMDGYEAARTIRAMDRPDAKTIPIIALTADAFEEDRRRCMEAGMSDFLAKPVEIDALKTLLGKYMRSGEKAEDAGRIL
ncbi:PAS domain-containing hybrid sensor histidine kinase/response regulator [uncultured Clostridium sp.]|uniref:PAS domain-containing hybrid sensor histidine kinase/response regulator n=1 Tax=uncultured Clostridium sp. TaxID=59620 RepID=UPI0025CDD995|nr:PAS domain-containing hybrid sensor histidine kinase/response regulator [uncultured Clostridium sp.]